MLFVTRTFNNFSQSYGLCTTIAVFFCGFSSSTVVPFMINPRWRENTTYSMVSPLFHLFPQQFPSRNVFDGHQCQSPCASYHVLNAAHFFWRRSIVFHDRARQWSRRTFSRRGHVFRPSSKCLRSSYLLFILSLFLRHSPDYRVQRMSRIFIFMSRSLFSPLFPINYFSLHPQPLLFYRQRCCQHVYCKQFTIFTDFSTYPFPLKSNQLFSYFPFARRTHLKSDSFERSNHGQKKNKKFCFIYIPLFTQLSMGLQPQLFWTPQTIVI